MLTQITRWMQQLRQMDKNQGTVGRLHRAGRLLSVAALALSVCMTSAPAQDAGDDTIARRVQAFAEAYDDGQFEDAAALGEAALRMSRRTFGDDAEQTAFLMLNLAKVYLRLSRPDDARLLFSEARDSLTGTYGAGHPAVLDAELGLAAVAESDDPVEAVRLYAGVVEAMRTLPQADLVMLANAEVGLARAQRLTGDEAAALATYRTAITRFAESLGPFHPATAQTRAAWASVQPSQWIAADTLMESWRVLRRALGDSHPETERVGMAAAQTMLDLGLAFDAMEIALPLSVRARPATRDVAIAMLQAAWSARQDAASAIRTVRAASPPEDAEATAKEAAAAHLAITLIRFDRPTDAALAIDRARRLIGSLGNADPELAEALARMADPVQAIAASQSTTDLLAEATTIVARLDPAHPRRAELNGLIALASAHQALADGRPDEAQHIARAAVDQLTGADDPRGILRLRLRTALANAFIAAGDDRLAAVACNGLERDIDAAPRSVALAADTTAPDAPPLLAPDEAIKVLQVCEAYWSDSGATDRLRSIQSMIAGWQRTAEFWPDEVPVLNASEGD